MALLSMQDVSLSFGGPVLLDGVNLQIEPGERLCLIGRNGCGKSTLMKMIKGDVEPDSGEISRQQSLRVAYLSQEVPLGIEGAVFDVIAAGLEEDDGWEGHRRIEKILSQMKLNGDTPFKILSAGLKRRVLLARGLAADPHILLLDEPTNHLDIDAITWMEDFLLRYGGTLLFVTHDRVFLQKLATRIIELDRGRLTNWNCDYQNYLSRKEALLDAESTQNARFDKKLSQEEAWIRQGIKARRTRNEGRVRVLERMREERRVRRGQIGNVRMQLQDTSQSGRLVIEAKNLSCGYGGLIVARNLSTLIMRGDKIGIIGPNGAGKTTLIRTLLGEQPPVAGEVRLGTNLNIAYFGQMREQLDDDKTVGDNVSEGNDSVIINGKSRHIIGYLQDFLFTPDRIRSRVKVLSGGERNRLLLAKLFTKPSNMIVMDEPTNDLDMETLELLEEMLCDYKGTLLLVSHDRAFINNIVTSTLVFEGEGKVMEYVGGYDDWLNQRDVKRKDPVQKTGKGQGKEGRSRKMSFKEKKELEELPGRIETLEAERESAYQLMAHPGTYQKRGGEIAAANEEIEEIEKKLNLAYKRWEELEEMKAAIDEATL